MLYSCQTSMKEKERKATLSTVSNKRALGSKLLWLGWEAMASQRRLARHTIIVKYLRQDTCLATKSIRSINRSSLTSHRISSRHPILRGISPSTRVNSWEGIACPLSMSRGRKIMTRQPRSWMTWRSFSKSKVSSLERVLKAPVQEEVVGETSKSLRVSFQVLSMNRSAIMSRRSNA